MVEVGTLVILPEVALQYDWIKQVHVDTKLGVVYLLVSHAFTLAGVGTVDWLLRYLAITPACREVMCMCACVCVYIYVSVYACVYVRVMYSHDEDCALTT